VSFLGMAHKSATGVADENGGGFEKAPVEEGPSFDHRWGAFFVGGKNGRRGKFRSNV